MKLGRMIVLAGAVALFAVACGGGGGNGATTQPPVATGTTQTPTASPTGGGTQGTTLVLKDNVFDPADFTVAAGSQITLKNEGAALHNFSVEGQNIDKDIQPGETENEDILEGLQPGTYTMFCKYHRSIGMEGTLTISG